MLLALILFSLPLLSQHGLVRRAGLTFHAGPTFFFPDIGGYSVEENWFGLRDIGKVHPRYSYGLDFHYWLTGRISARLGVTAGSLYATDEGGYLPDRGYSCDVSIVDNIFVAELHLLKNRPGNSNKGRYIRGRKKGPALAFLRIDPYVFSGIGAVFYNVTPNERLSAAMVPPVGSSLTIPAGIGTSISLSPSFSAMADFSGRYSMTDRIDGFPSKFSKANDIYYFVNAGITWKIPTGRGKNRIKSIW